MYSLSPKTLLIQVMLYSKRHRQVKKTNCSLSPKTSLIQVTLYSEKAQASDNLTSSSFIINK